MARDVSYTFDPFEIAGIDSEEFSERDKAQVLRDVKDAVLTQVLSDTASGRSAVDGSRWEKLSPGYKKVKSAAGRGSSANLEFDGDMLAATKIEEAGSTELKLYVESSQSDKADGHNNHSGDSQLPTRRFIPSADDGDTFRSGIMRDIKSIVEENQPHERASQANSMSIDEALESLVDKGVKVRLRRG